MSQFLKNVGLEAMVETEDRTKGLIAHIAEKGECIEGYYGSPYINLHFGDVQMIVRVGKSEEEEGHYEVLGLDTHEAGNCVWDVRLNSDGYIPKDGEQSEQRCVITRLDGTGGFAFVNIVNADVLPSYLKDDQIKMQVVGYPTAIDFYADEKAYAASVPADKMGKKLMLADGCLFPTGALHNANHEDDPLPEDLMQFKGIVEKALCGYVKLGEEEAQCTYIRTIINTEFGRLELLHTVEMVKEEQRELIKAGSVVTGLMYLSGDVAIYDYDKGVIHDAHHDLRALREVLNGASPQRLNAILTDETDYTSRNITIRGKREIIDRFTELQANQAKKASEKCHAYLAHIVDIDDGDDPLDYGIGTECIVLRYGEEEHYDSIVFIDTDSNGNIARIAVSRNSRYHFKIESCKDKSPLADLEVPGSYMELMLNRAHYHGFINTDTPHEEILKVVPDYNKFKANAERMIEAVPDDWTGREKEYTANLFGYLFAKAVEGEYADLLHMKEKTDGLLAQYSPNDAFFDTFQSDVNEPMKSHLLVLKDLGKQFLKDFEVFHPLGVPEADFYVSELIDALILAQQIGKVYAGIYFFKNDMNHKEDPK